MPPEPAQPQQARRTPPRSTAPSIISADMTVVGTVTATGDIQVDGKIEGDLFSTSLTVGEKAVVNGEVRADEVTIRGHVVGGIKARKINLSSTCHVEGDLVHNALSVETGAFFQGNIKHSDDPLSDQQNEARPPAGPPAANSQGNGSRGSRPTFSQYGGSQGEEAASQQADGKPAGEAAKNDSGGDGKLNQRGGSGSGGGQGNRSRNPNQNRNG